MLAIDKIERLMLIAKEDLPAGTDVGEAVFSEKGRARFLRKTNSSLMRHQIMLARLKLAGFRVVDGWRVIEDPVALADHENEPLPDVIEKLKAKYLAERKEALRGPRSTGQLAVSTKVD